MAKVKGATPAEQKTVKAAKKAPTAEPVAKAELPDAAVAPRAHRRAKLEAEHARIQATRAEDTPEAKATPAEQKVAAEDQFAKADAAVVGNPDDPGEFRLRMAALGGL